MDNCYALGNKTLIDSQMLLTTLSCFFFMLVIVLCLRLICGWNWMKLNATMTTLIVVYKETNVFVKSLKLCSTLKILKCYDVFRIECETSTWSTLLFLDN